MAEDNNNSGAQSKLGELFVDFGTRGLGGLVKGLNKIQAQFLLTKNAGEQFVKTLVNIPKKSGDAQVSFEKISNISNLTVKQLRQLRQLGQESGLKDVVGDVLSLEQNINRLITLGKGGNLEGWALLGLNPADMDTTKPLENMLKIYNALEKIQDKSKRYMVAQMFGFDDNTMMALKKWNGELKTNIELNEEEGNQLRRNAEATGHLAAAWTLMGEKIMANTKWIDDIIEKLARLVEVFANTTAALGMTEGQATKRAQELTGKNYKKESQKAHQQAAIAGGITGAVSGAITGGAMAAPMGLLAPVGALIGGAIGGVMGAGAGWKLGGDKLLVGKKTKVKSALPTKVGVEKTPSQANSVNAVQQYSPISLAPKQQPLSLSGEDKLSKLPPNLQSIVVPSNSGKNITINQTNNINATGNVNELQRAIERGNLNTINAVNGRDN